MCLYFLRMERFEGAAKRSAFTLSSYLSVYYCYGFYIRYIKVKLTFKPLHDEIIRCLQFDHLVVETQKLMVIKEDLALLQFFTRMKFFVSLFATFVAVTVAFVPGGESILRDFALLIIYLGFSSR